MRNVLLSLYCVAALALVSPARAQSLNLEAEFSFAEKLVDNGFSDYANRVMDNVVLRHPDQADRAQIIKAQGFIVARKFADAEAVLNAMPAGNPKRDAITLALANGYYRFNELDKARALYKSFFDLFAPPPADPDLLKFYRDAAYRFSLMLKGAGDLQGAADALTKVIASNPEREIGRSMMADQSQLYIELARKTQDKAARDGYLAKAEKLAKDIQWGGVDIAFGQSIITLATIELTRGDRARAESLITKEYREMLAQIDGQLAEADMAGQSPQAGARFLLGEMYEQDGEAMLADPEKKAAGIAKLGQSLGEYYNVFVKYGDSDWGPEAGVRSARVKSRLEGLGKTVKIDLGAQAEKAAATTFRLADNLFRQKQYQEAVEAYLKALNLYPETTSSLKALGALISCYIELNDPIMVRAVSSYVAERFPNRPDGAIALLAAASQYINRKDEVLAAELYDRYLAANPKHEKAGTILFYLGSQRKKAGDEVGASRYYQRIVDHYPQDQYYPKALTLMAWGFYQAGKYDEAMAGFQKLVNDVPPGPDRATAQFTLADCHVRNQRWPQAAQELRTLVKWLSNEAQAYASNEADAAKNQKLLEQGMFQLANCLGRIDQPAEQALAFKAAGMKTYDEFIAKFPKSELAPKAMMGKGQILLAQRKFDEATATFDALSAQYPQSEEGKNALYSLARSAMEIGQYDQAKAAFEKMMTNTDRYKPDEFTRIGQLMIDAKLYDQAVAAFNRVKDNPAIQAAKELPENRSLLERALIGLGRANVARKDFAAATEALDRLMTDYPKSGLFFDAKFLQGEAYAEQGQPGKASEAMSDIFRFASDQIMINRASVRLGDIQRKAGDLPAALASYQRVALLGDPNKPEQRPMIEQAILSSIEVSSELGRFADVIENCDLFVKTFPASDRLAEIRRARNEANLKVGQ